MAVLAIFAGSATTSEIRTPVEAAPQRCGGHVHPDKGNGPRHGWRPFQRLAKHAWRAERWQKADPRTAKQRKRMRHQRRCAVAGHRKVMQRIAKRQRRQHAAHRKRRLAHVRKWGSCRHDAPPGSQAVLDCIRGAATHYGVSSAMLTRKARCESGLNRLATNSSSTASGLFQFLYPGTWSTTPYRHLSVWSAKAQSLAAAWMHRVGRGGEWVCR